MDSKLILDILSYIIATVIGIIVIINLFYKKKYRTAIIAVIIFLTVVQVGSGYMVYANYKLGNYTLVRTVIDHEFINLNHETNGAKEIDQMVFKDAGTLSLTNGEGTVEVPYQVMGNETFCYQSQNNTGQVYTGVIDKNKGKLSIIVTSQSGTMEFVEKK